MKMIETSPILDQIKTNQTAEILNEKIYKNVKKILKK